MKSFLDAGATDFESFLNDMDVEQDAATDFEDGLRSVVVPNDREVEREEIERVEKLFLFPCGAP